MLNYQRVYLAMFGISDCYAETISKGFEAHPPYSTESPVFSHHPRTGATNTANWFIRKNRAPKIQRLLLIFHVISWHFMAITCGMLIYPTSESRPSWLPSPARKSWPCSQTNTPSVRSLGSLNRGSGGWDTILHQTYIASVINLMDHSSQGWKGKDTKMKKLD